MELALVNLDGIVAPCVVRELQKTQLITKTNFIRLNLYKIAKIFAELQRNLYLCPQIE